MIEAISTTPALAHFSAPADSFASIDSETVSALISVSSDVTLVVDAHGVVRDAAFGEAGLAKEVYRNWIGLRWLDIVAPDSRGKIEELMRDTTMRTASRWRQVNYPTGQGPDIPIRHSVVRYGEDRRLVVVGRDLRAMAALQQRLAEARQPTRLRRSGLCPGQWPCKNWKLKNRLSLAAMLALWSSCVRRQKQPDWIYRCRQERS